MRTENASISLTAIEIEMLLASLSYYEQKFLTERPEHLANGIRVLRQKLLDIP